MQLIKTNPKPGWLRVYTDDSKIRMHGHVQTGVYYQEFVHYIPIGAEKTAFEREVKAIEVVH